MQQRLIFTFSSSSRLKMIALSCCLFMLSFTARAIVLVYPNPPVENTFASLGTPIYTLNADMLEVPGGELFAMTWDLYGPPAGVTVQIGDFTGATASIFIPSVAEALPDIVLANDLANPGKYLIALVYMNSSSQVQFDTYTIGGTGSGTLTIAPRSHVIVAGAGRYPHIDMFTDFNTMVGAFPSMHRFVISYASTPAGASVVERHGDVASPTTLSTPFTIMSGSCTYGGDVACAMDPATNKQHVYFAITNGLSLIKSQIDLNPAASPVAPPISGVSNTVLYPGAGSSGPLLPRIEAMGYNGTGSGVVPWVIGAIVNNPSNFHNEVWEFNDNIPGGFNCSSPLFPLDENLCVEVSAGAGKPASNICNKFYNIGWHNTKAEFLTQAIDASTGAISTAFPDYYKANLIAAPFTWSKVPVALTSCSNSGRELLTGWWDNNYSGNIYYKLKAGVSGYRPAGPTGVNTVKNNAELVIFPNPTSDKLVIMGDVKADYTIVSLSGQTITGGKIDGTNYNLDVSKLAAGSYILSLTTSNGKQVVRFTKQ